MKQEESFILGANYAKNWGIRTVYFVADASPAL
jgi:hypothetical protein